MLTDMPLETRTIGIAQIRCENPNQSEVVSLIAASDEYLAALYPAESNHLVDVKSLAGAEVTFFVARMAGTIVGCGAIFRRGTEYVEIKRMFVAPAARGIGLGRQILETLEQAASKRGFKILRLETGVRQPEALRLYRSAGFVEVGPFGEYTADRLSIFMEKRLTEE